MSHKLTRLNACRDTIDSTSRQILPLLLLADATPLFLYKMARKIQTMYATRTDRIIMRHF